MSNGVDGPREASSPSSLRTLGRLRVLEALNHGEHLSRPALTRQTGLARATVGSLVADLITEGIVADSGPTAAPGLMSARGDGGPSAPLGRPARLVHLLPGAAYAVGLDIARDHLRCALCDLSGRPVSDSGALPFEVETDPIGALQTAVELIRDATGDISSDRLLGVGVGIASPVDRHAGALRRDGILSSWADVPLADELEAAVGLPVRLINDANAGMLAERRSGAAQACDDAIYLRLSAGIGAGIICDGRMLLGASGLAGELGHVSVNPNGLLCRCGNRGCLETVASPAALAGELAGKWGRPVTARQLIEHVRSGQPDAVSAVERAGTAVGRAVAHAVTLLNPSLLIVGGDLADAGEHMYAPMRAAIERHTMRAHAQSVTVVSGSLGDSAGVRGAAALILSDAPRRLADLLPHDGAGRV